MPTNQNSGEIALGDRFDITEYWDRRYRQGRNSGAGSYGRLAQFKARILNAFVQEQRIGSVIEFGCGDGNQLSLAAYPSYVGTDVSEVAIEMCVAKFAGDATKRFVHEAGYVGERADLSLSLDVVYHLIGDLDFDRYMTQVFDAARRFAIIYSSNDPDMHDRNSHVRHRRFTDWAANRSDFSLADTIPSDFPLALRETEGLDQNQYSPSDFYIFARRRG